MLSLLTMPVLRHLVKHLQQGGFRKQRLLYGVAFMIFFFALGDSILTYIMPLLITENGFSHEMMGLIIGSSSLVGAAFDILVSRFLHKPHYRRLYLAVLILAGLFGVLLFQAKAIWIYLIAMAVWGIYWDIFHFANYDFVSRISVKINDAAEFGVLDAFKALGSLLGPVLTGLVISRVVGVAPFILSAAAFIFYLLVLNYPNKHTQEISPAQIKTKG